MLLFKNFFVFFLLFGINDSKIVENSNYCVAYELLGMQLNSFINEFNYGFNNEDQFLDFLERFEYYNESVEDLVEGNYSTEYKELFRKSDALYSFFGELSPDSRNFSLSYKKFNLAVSILNINFYYHPELKGGDPCMPLYICNLWDNKFTSIIAFNESNKIMKFSSEVVKVIDFKDSIIYTSEVQMGVNCYSMRSVDSHFHPEDATMLCETLKCWVSYNGCLNY